MGGLYLHIPFCRQACHYCDFHFSTSRALLGPVVQAMEWELGQRAAELRDSVHTLYLGGGTPSLLPQPMLERLLTAVRQQYALEPNAEVTLEANPDDMSSEALQTWLSLGINRLSVGVQSFDSEALRWMNRSHDAPTAVAALQRAAAAGFGQVSLDLMYGLPGMDATAWQRNVEQALELQPTHLSAYCLTVEQGTALGHRVRRGIEPAVDEDAAAEQFTYLGRRLQRAGYERYEVSNYARDGQYSRHNSNYWRGQDYLGIGPAAHSLVGSVRSWNVANNGRYVRGFREGRRVHSSELLGSRERINEYLMLGLRTRWGIDLSYLQAHLGYRFTKDEYELLKRWEHQGLAQRQGEVVVLTEQGFLQADALASALFVVDG